MVSCLGLAAPTFVGSAAAQVAVDAKQAKTRLDKGRVLFAKKAFFDARKELVAAWELAALPAAAYWAGRSCEELGEPVCAVEWYGRALVRGKLDPVERDDARIRMAALKRKPVTVTVVTEPSGATVRIDGTEVPQKTPFVLQIVPGRHVFVIEVDAQTTTKKLDVAPLKPAYVKMDLGSGKPKPTKATNAP